MINELMNGEWLPLLILLIKLVAAFGLALPIYQALHHAGDGAAVDGGGQWPAGGRDRWAPKRTIVETFHAAGDDEEARPCYGQMTVCWAKSVEGVLPHFNA